MEKLKSYRQAKVKRIQQHQKKLYKYTGKLSRQKTQEKGKPIENKHKTIKKMVVGSYISIITLTVNGLSTPTKRYRLAR